MKSVIVGTGRCGSTFLCDSLNRHPDIYVCNESYWHIPLLKKYGDRAAPVANILDAIVSVRFHDGRSILEVNLEAIGETLDAFLVELSGQFGDAPVTVMQVFTAMESALLRRTGKRVYMDKTPHYGYHLPELRQLWPGLKVVHLVRDGRECAVSMRQHEGFQMLAGVGVDDWTMLAPISKEVYVRQPPILDDDVYLDMWARQVEQSSAAVRRLPAPDWLELRYEDLLSAPEQVFLQLIRFLGVENDPDWLAGCLSSVRAPATTPEATAHIRISLFAADILKKYGYEVDVPASRAG